MPTTQWPTGRAPRATIEAQFGADRAELADWALRTGDPLADALVEEMHDRGMGASRRDLLRAAEHGLASVGAPGPALRAFFTHVEAAPAYVDDRLLDEGPLPFFTIELGLHIVALSAGSLVRVYQSPSIAYVLATTGRLVEGSERRLEETAKWVLEATLPGALRPGASGYVATLKVRLLHAHMRRLAREHSFDEAVHGTPINQVDLARTWMDFTLTSWTAHDTLGMDLRPGELEQLYRYWWYVAHLLGIDARLVEGITTHAAARRVDDLLQALTAAPTPDSATLANATLDSIGRMLQDQVGLPERAGLPLVRAISRKLQGAAMADQLKIPRSRAAEAAMPALVWTIRARRRHQRRTTRSWNAVVERNLTANRDALRESTDPAAYERGSTGTTD